jgi:hypothetical protein
MLIFFCKHVLYIKVAYAMKHVHRNVRSKKPNVGKEVEKYLQSNSQITKYRATRNLLKTGVKFRSTEDGFLSNVSLIFAL